jgi:hypothetical protein
MVQNVGARILLGATVPFISFVIKNSIDINGSMV